MHYNDIPGVLEQRFPEFRASHTRFDQDAEAGPGILIGALFYFFLDHFRLAKANDPEALALVERILAFLEEAAQAQDRQVRNVIQVEFMEHMWMASPEEYEMIKNRLGPASRKLLLATESY